MTRTRLEPRTEPQQQRSRDRVREILDATETLVTEVGYDGINTNLIAERAGMPVGTLYRYYSDKYGVFAAVAQRAFVDLESRWQELGQPDPDRITIEDYFDGIVDMMAGFWMDRKSAMLLWGVLRRTPEPVLHHPLLTTAPRWTLHDFRRGGRGDGCGEHDPGGRPDQRDPDRGPLGRDPKKGRVR